MQAINHVATALIFKRKFPTAPLMGLILATEAVEYLWVGLNVIGVEKTIIDTPMHSVADVHLAHMPFSHSIATNVIISLVVGLIVFWRSGRAATSVSIAIGLAVFSHIVLDVFVHGHDIALLPHLDTPMLGTGLYSDLPVPALILETLWGVFCWYYYRGSKKLLGVILALNATSIPIYSASINIGEGVLGGHNVIFALVIMGQMLATSALFWLFAREKTDQVVVPAAVKS